MQQKLSNTGWVAGERPAGGGFVPHVIDAVDADGLLSLLQAGAEISTVHPEQYAKRFRDFIANIFA